MRLKTYTALDMQDAMRQVRDDLGDDAVIVSTTRNPKGQGVAVTVAQDSELDGFGPAVIIDDMSLDGAAEAPVTYSGRRRSALPDYIVRDIEQILQYHGLTPDLTEKLLDALNLQPPPKDDSEESLHSLLAGVLREVLTFSALDYLKEGYRYVLIGSPGAGKTLTTAKLAARIVQEKQKVRLISTDNKRAGAIEQLAAYAEVLGCDLEIAESRVELKGILKGLSTEARLIVDSAGANPFDFQELKELAGFAGLIELEPILVFPAGSDPAQAAEIAQAFAFIGVEKILFTRFDIAKRYGAPLVAAFASGLAITHVSSGEKVLEDFVPADAAHLARLLMDYRTKRS